MAVAMEVDVLLNVMEVAGFRADAEAALTHDAARRVQKPAGRIDLVGHGRLLTETAG
jgi:hypothetical protein